MRTLLGFLFLLIVACPAEAARDCSVPRIRTLTNQTVDGNMTVKTGKRCSIVMLTSRGPTSGAKIVERPSHGSVSIGGQNRITYVSRAGFTGQDGFSYSRTGLDHLNNASERTVRVRVTVTP